MGGSGNHPPLDTLSHRSVEMAPPAVSGKDRHHLGARGRGGTNGVGFDHFFSEIKFGQTLGCSLSPFWDPPMKCELMDDVQQTKY